MKCRYRVGVLSLFLAGVLAGCSGDGRTGLFAERQAPLFDGMGSHGRQITTDSAEAQRYFDQGLVWAYAFNHDEAIRSFTAATEADPECAMAWWGIALCHGPHINFPIVPEERAVAAWAALEKAQQHGGKCQPWEQDLIKALAARYAHPQPADRRPLDEAYASAMQKVWETHRNDPDIGTLYAESLMDLQPWDLWTPSGQPKGRTTEVIAVLEAVRAINPDHPGANHLYIHAVEASPFPEKGNEAADRLRQAVPVSGHLVHMPSHIDIQTGRWAQAADQNEQAIAADRRYKAKASRKQELYRVYMAHNNHMLTFAAMMEGRKARALESARTMLAAVPPDYIEAHPDWIDPYLAVPIEVLMRFGEWDTILREPAPPKNVPVSNAMWRFARAVAYAAKGDVPSAEREQARFREAVARVPSNWYVNFNPAQKLLAIAEHMLEGEIAYRRGEIDRSVAELRKAIAIEDTLMYMEPPDWPQPVRHTLGAVLVDAGRYAEAEEVYRQDLKIWPENGWALHGLATALNAQGKGAEAGEIEARFAKVWARADTDIGSSCLCVPGKKAHTVAAR